MSVIQAVMITQLIKTDKFDPITYCATDLDLAKAIVSIIRLVCNPNKHVQIANFQKDKSTPFDVSIQQIE